MAAKLGQRVPPLLGPAPALASLYQPNCLRCCTLSETVEVIRVKYTTEKPLPLQSSPLQQGRGWREQAEQK